MEHQSWWDALLPVIFTGLLCIQAEYYFVNEAKTWMDARDYCRLTYSDLATVQTQQDQDELLKAAKGASYTAAWIGLQQIPPNWKWSTGEQVTYNEWNKYYFCALSNQYGTWVDTRCYFQYPFMCYTATANGARNYTMVNTAMSWTDAQQYCKQYHTDLVSILSASENAAVMKAAQGVVQYWIGLSNNPWKWSDGQQSQLRDWMTNWPQNEANTQKCVLALWNGWMDYFCNNSYRFYCCDNNKLTSIANRCKLVLTADTWPNAVQHCSQTNTHLLTAQQQSDLTDLRQSGQFVWIGLYHGTQNWTWSDGEDAVYTSWKLNVSSPTGICGKVTSLGYWDDDYCSTTLPFMCNTGTNSGSLNLTLVTQPMSWPNAQSYCRQKYTDLVSIQNANDMEAVRNATPTGTEFWIGLYTDPWIWSDGQDTKFSSWQNPKPTSNMQCGSVNTAGTWKLYNCATTAPFFCSGLPITYKAVVRFTFGGLTVDQNPEDPLLAEQVLNKIKENLSQQTSLSNITFTWKTFGKESYENSQDTCDSSPV